MKLSQMTKAEKSLLLYLETRAVDYGGLVCPHSINSDDHEIMKKWNKERFIRYGRRPFADIEKPKSSGFDLSSHWAFLSEEAWGLAHEERELRAKRNDKTEAYRS